MMGFRLNIPATEAFTAAQRRSATRRHALLITVTAVAVSMVALAAPTRAQGLWDPDEKKTELHIRGAVDAPLSPDVFADNWNIGFGFGFGFGLQLTPKTWLLGSFDAYRNAPKSDIVPGQSVSGGNVWISYAAIELRYVFGRSGTRPYVFGGVGLFGISITEATVGSMIVPLEYKSDNGPGVHAGAGILLGRFFVEAAYVGGALDEFTSIVPVRAGIIWRI